MLALVSGAALFPASILYERLPPGSPARWGTLVHFHPEVPVPEEGDRPAKVAAMTQACADALARGIDRAPQDWHMLQRVFLSDLDAGVPAAAADTGG
jgi:KDO2-lipid IV(A) lauroyltransferase